MVEPNRVAPNTDIAEPRQPTVRIARELPSVTKSRIATDDPKRLRPNVDAADPSAENERKLKLLPRWTKSNTARPEPRREKERRAKALPR
jgi:hypothetical protein